MFSLLRIFSIILNILHKNAFKFAAISVLRNSQLPDPNQIVLEQVKQINKIHLNVF